MVVGRYYIYRMGNKQILNKLHTDWDEWVKKKEKNITSETFSCKECNH